MLFNLVLLLSLLQLCTEQMLAAAYTAPAAAATVLRLPAVISAVDTTFQQLPEGQVSQYYYHML
jgi:hypothetical protein